MKRKIRSVSAILVCASFTSIAHAQAPGQSNGFRVSSTDIAATFTVERAKLQGSPCSCFWLKGGSAEGAVTFYHGLGAVVSLTAEHASNIAPGVNLGLLSYMVGPRYTFTPARSLRIYGEGLVGGAHGFDSVFPGPSSSTFSATSFSTQVGVGSDIAIHNGFGIRLFEADYVHTSLPNNGSNSQNDLRLSFGLSYRSAH